MKLSNINENKKYIIIIIGLLFICAIGFTFAFFQAQNNDGKAVDVNAKSYSVDELSFDIGDDITLNPNQFNFGKGQGDVSGETTAKVTLLANNKTKLASMTYNVYLAVNINEFEYSTSEKLPELVLYIEGPDGVVTSIDGFGNAKDVTDSNGNSFKAFDITEFNGYINIVNNKPIEVTSNDNGKKEENWKVKVIFLNLDNDQRNNTDKNFDAKFIVQKNNMIDSLSDVILSGDDLSLGIKLLYEKGESGRNMLYHHDGSLTYGIDDGSYRYSGFSPNNYVCFGSDDATCPVDNLYRIIGVFDGEVKLIKADYATTEELGNNGGFVTTTIDSNDLKYYSGSQDIISLFAWDSSSHGISWSDSNLNTVNLNTNFLSFLGNKWSNMIADHDWASSYCYYDAFPAEAYQEEQTNINSISTAKIGLMSVSDFGFASNPTKWSPRFYDYGSENIYDNWMYMGVSEWTISSFTKVFCSNCAYYITSGGASIYMTGIYSGRFAIRPVFYLKENVKFISGKGTKTDPIRISL